MFPVLISFVFLKAFVNLFKSRLTVNNNLIGDVNAVFMIRLKIFTKIATTIQLIILYLKVTLNL